MVARDGVEPPTPAFSATLCCSLNDLIDSRWPPKYLRSRERHANRGLESGVQKRTEKVSKLGRAQRFHVRHRNYNIHWRLENQTNLKFAKNIWRPTSEEFEYPEPTPVERGVTFFDTAEVYRCPNERNHLLPCPCHCAVTRTQPHAAKPRTLPRSLDANSISNAPTSPTSVHRAEPTG